MNQIKKNFIYRNESFCCEKCKKENPKGEGFIRNHCRYCLCSKHVDEFVPGDRAAECGGLMIAEAVLYNKKKGFVLVHKCINCAKTIKNMVVEDDNMDLIATISAKGYVEE
jgi:hypothetical protein